ncbi:hypothetical protein K439DRAFT_1625185 [Ramaria rubella]|nr:hypothetical protein K439DRAFT_1625185 [Ramaria rubella]
MAKSPWRKKASHKPMTSPPVSPLKVLEAQLLLAKVDAANVNSKQRKKMKSKAVPSKLSNKQKKTQVERVGSDGEVVDDGTPNLKKARRSKPHLHHMSDQLIGLIEDNAMWKVTFSFEKETMDAVPTGFLRVLKTLYIDCRHTMTATGMGLIEEDHTHEIVPGTELMSIWENICKRCPWYKHLHDLLGSSPVVE